MIFVDMTEQMQSWPQLKQSGSQGFTAYWLTRRYSIEYAKGRTMRQAVRVI